MSLRDASSLTPLIAALPHLRCLTDLKLHDVQFGQSSSSFFTALSSLSANLNSLYIIGGSDLSLSDLSKTLAELGNLYSLALALCRFRPALTVDDVRSFLAALRQTPIADLRLTFFVPSADVLEAIISSLPDLSTLRRLCLTDCRLGDTEAQADRAEKLWSDCFATLSKCPKLNSFWASSHSPLPLKCSALATLLPKTHLTDLQLPDTGIPPEQQTQIKESVSSLLDWKCEVSF
jgi:hypothetical protein